MILGNVDIFIAFKISESRWLSIESLSDDDQEEEGGGVNNSINDEGEEIKTGRIWTDELIPILKSAERVHWKWS